MKVFVILACVLLVTMASPKQQLTEDSDSRVKGEYESITPDSFYDGRSGRQSYFDNSYQIPIYQNAAAAPYFTPYPLYPQFRRYVRPSNPTDGSMDDQMARNELDSLRSHFYPADILASADPQERSILTKIAFKALALQLLFNPSGFITNLNTLGSSLAKLYYTETVIPLPFFTNEGIQIPVLTTTR